MGKIAVLGDKESVLVFKGFGADVFIADPLDAVKNKKLLDKLVRAEYALILITDQVAQELDTTIQHYRKNTIPSITVLPSGDGDFAAACMKRNVERAIGVDLIKIKPALR